MNKIKGLDYRSIGLFRIAMGLFVIYNLISLKLNNFDSFFSVAKAYIPAPIKSKPVFENILISDISVLLLFLLVFIWAVLMVIGYRSRVCATLLFAFYAFFNSTYWHLSFGFDRYIEVLLFASIWLPLDKRFSLFKSQKKLEYSSTESYSKWPAYFILLQIGLIYTISGVSKNGVLWQNGTAVGVLLLDDLMTLPLAAKLYSNGILTKSLTYATILFESVALILLFFPWKNQTTRLVFCCSILCFHWGLSFFVNVGHFKLVGTLAVLLLLPKLFWNYAKPLETFLSKFESTRQLKLNLSFPNSKWMRITWKSLGIFIIYAVLINNIYMISRQGDAMGKFMRKHHLDNVAKTMNIGFLEKLGTVFNQNWYFYAPNPNIYLGKICFVGTTHQGETIDLETDERFVEGNYVPSKKYSDLQKYFNTKLRNQINKQKNTDMTNEYAQYLVVKWENQHKMPLKEINVYNYFFNARKVVEGNPKQIEVYNFISVDLDEVRRPN